jgi:hypothetical protein
MDRLARKTTILVAGCAIALLCTYSVFAQCVTLKSGSLVYQPGRYLAGQPLKLGVDDYGYNYQAHSFNGSFFNSYANGANFPPYNGDDAAYLAADPLAALYWAWPYRSVDLAMKWNDAWLSNRDCNFDGKLDRPDDFGGTYIGSGAWLTNHESWTVTIGGTDRNANDFLKVVARPTGSYIADPMSYFGEQTVYVNGKVLGDQIWGDFAVVQYNLNDPSTGDHGPMLKSQISAGLGRFRP